MNKVPILIVLIGLLGNCSSAPKRSDARNTAIDAKRPQSKQTRELIRGGEYHFMSLKQLTFKGKNSEPFFNAQGTEIVFQSKRDGFQCGQTFHMDSEGKNIQLSSTGLGQTRAAYLFPHSPKLVFSSTHKTLKYCDPSPSDNLDDIHLHPDLDIYVTGDHGKSVRALSPRPGYEVQSAISPGGDAILFTTTRGGDIDVWIMDPDGTNAKQLTKEVGYDGRAVFNNEGTKIVYEANHPNEKNAIDEYQSALKENLHRPKAIDLFVMNRDGSNKTNILSNGATNSAPYFHPDGKRIIFSSNMDDAQRRNFDLYLINVDGSGLERVTYSPGVNAFPVFSRDGKQLAFSSNRGSKKAHQTNIFVAEWTDLKPKRESLSKDSKTRWIEHVKKLSSSEMGGRGIGTEGIKRAETYLVNQLNKIGYEASTQTFLVDIAVAIDRGKFQIKNDEILYDATKKDVQPFSFSGDGEVSGDIIFVGRGSQGKDWDDYKGLEVEGKTVVVFGVGTGHKYIAINAQHHGAKAVIIINRPNLKKDIVAKFEQTRGGVQIPVMSMTWAFANKIFKDLSAIRIDATKKITRQPEGKFNVDLAAKIRRHGKKAQNVVATLAGLSQEKRGAIVVGAHFDHLGFGGEGSLSPEEKAIHPGADDNASGVATVLEIAKHLKSTQTQFKRDIIFVLFSGEESGLLGSQHFVSDPTLMKNVEFMVNFDMIGRMKEGKVNFTGTGTAVGLADVIRRSQIGLNINLEMASDGFGPSDQSSFFAKQIPVLHFFTGLHEDYHRPSDTFEKLNIDGAYEIGTLALRIIQELANQEEIKFKDVKSAKAIGKSPSKENDAYFGSLPSLPANANGVLMEGARRGSPAEKAGIRKGDILVKFGKYDVQTVKAFMSALGKYKAGSEVVVVIERDGIQMKLNARLAKKRK